MDRTTKNTKTQRGNQPEQRGSLCLGVLVVHPALGPAPSVGPIFEAEANVRKKSLDMYIRPYVH